MIDYHIHTTYTDGEGSIEEVCRVAEERGIDEIAITDHLIIILSERNLVTAEEIPKIVEEIERIRKNSKVRIKLGIEIDYFEGSEKEIEKIIDDNPFDIVLGSTHFVDGILIDEPQLYNNNTQIEVYKKYFSRLKHAVESQLFDIMAHPDFIRRFAVPFYKNEIPFEKIQNQIKKIAELLADNNIGIEVNASGLRHNMINDSYPTSDFLKVCEECGVKIITIGSDAHHLEHIGFGLEGCLEKLRNVGYEKISLFNERKPKLIPIKSF